MGNEIGQLREWDETREQDWELLKFPKHDSFHEFILALNKLYQSHPALYQGEYNKDNFKWLEVNAMNECVYIYERKSNDERLIIALNFSNNNYDVFDFGIGDHVIIEEILNSDLDIYGGETPINTVAFRQESIERDEGYYKYCLSISISAFSAKIFKVKKI